MLKKQKAHAHGHLTISLGKKNINFYIQFNKPVLVKLLIFWKIQLKYLGEKLFTSTYSVICIERKYYLNTVFYSA